MDSIRLGDCSKVLPTLPARSVALVFTSPPFANARRKHYGGPHPDHYVEWFSPISRALIRVLRDDGSFVLNIKERCIKGERHTYVLDLIHHMRGQGWLWTEEYLWVKTCSAPGKWPNRFRDGWERLLHFTKSRRFYMNQDAVRVPAGEKTRARARYTSARDRRRMEHRTGSGFGSRRAAWVGRELVYPDNVLVCAPQRANVGHPAPFPRELPEFFIKLLSKPGALVLDNFCGSATTGLVAHELGGASSESTSSGDTWRWRGGICGKRRRHGLRGETEPPASPCGSAGGAKDRERRDGYNADMGRIESRRELEIRAEIRATSGEIHQLRTAGKLTPEALAFLEKRIADLREKQEQAKEDDMND